MIKDRGCNSSAHQAEFVCQSSTSRHSTSPSSSVLLYSWHRTIQPHPLLIYSLWQCTQWLIASCKPSFDLTCGISMKSNGWLRANKDKNPSLKSLSVPQSGFQSSLLQQMPHQRFKRAPLAFSMDKFARLWLKCNCLPIDWSTLW